MNLSMQEDRLAHRAKSTIARYLRHFPQEQSRLAQLSELLNSPGDAWARGNMAGHATAGALILDSSCSHLLLVWHKALSRWVTPGGHADAGEWLADTAAREALEETGLTGLVPHPWHSAHDGIPLDIDSHPIPANSLKGEGAHFHHDFRYIFTLAGGLEPTLAVDEVTAFRWLPMDTAQAATVSPGTSHIVQKLLRL